MAILANGKRVRESHIVNQYDCGCAVVSEFESGRGINIIEYCPKHAAAPELYEACKALCEGIRYITGPLPTQTKKPYLGVLAALAKADGKE